MTILIHIAPIYLNAPFDYAYKRAIHPDWQKIFEYQDDPDIRSRFLVISLHSNATTKPINTSLNGADAFYISNKGVKNANYYTGYTNEEHSFYFGNLLLDRIGTLGIQKRKVSEQVYLMIREHSLTGQTPICGRLSKTGRCLIAVCMMRGLNVWAVSVALWQGKETAAGI